MEQLGVFLVLIFVIIINLVIAQDLNPYHYIIKGFVRKNFKCVQEHRYDEVLNGVSDKQLEHTFAGDNCLGGTRRDKESLKRWFERVGTVLPDLKFEITDIQVKGTPAKTLVIARWIATCNLLNGDPYLNKGVHFITLKWGKAVKFDVYEDTQTVSHGLELQFQAGIKEAKAPKIES
jgi:ketosteroid isomerase-like protein